MWTRNSSHLDGAFVTRSITTKVAEEISTSTGFCSSIRCLTLVVAAFLSTGCISGTYTAKVNVVPTTLPVTNRSASKVALILEKSFTEYSRRFRSTASDNGGAGNDYYPIGSPLRSYALNLTENRFREVSVFGSESEAIGKCDAILIPRVSKMVQGWRVGYFSKLSMIIVVEWTLKDKSGEKVLAAIPVSAEAEVPQANGFLIEGRMGQLISVLFDNLSKSTQASFLECKEMSNPGN